MDRTVRGALKSKTLYFNLITLVLMVFEVYTKNYVIDPTLVAVVNGIGNAILRFLTSQPLNEK